MDIYDRVLKCVCEQSGLDRDEIRIDDKLMDDIGFDSLDFIELEMLLEEEFDVNNGRWSEDNLDLGNCNATVGGLVELVEKRLQKLGKI